MDFFGTSSRSFVRVFKSAASTSSTNSPITITLAAVTGARHYIVGFLWSYSDAPIGRISTTGLDGDQLDFDITTSGPGPVLTPPAVGTLSGAVGVTLAAGGAGVVGKLTIWYATVPS